MHDRHLAAGPVGIAVLVLGVSLAGMPAGHGIAVAAAAEAQSGAQQGASAHRTPWGDPDLQGVWDFRTITPLERPAELADQAFLTEPPRQVSKTLYFQ